tara:strand:- start:985 stop:1329 length:345 start_codon:yes stop_codon:yes gene_type:complete
MSETGHNRLSWKLQPVGGYSHQSRSVANERIPIGKRLDCTGFRAGVIVIHHSRISQLTNELLTALKDFHGHLLHYCIWFAEQSFGVHAYRQMNGFRHAYIDRIILSSRNATGKK